MKIALCLSGQPRSIDAGFNALNQSILKHNNVDVFIHTWNGIDRYGNITNISKITEEFNPCRILISEKQNLYRFLPNEKYCQ